MGSAATLAGTLSSLSVTFHAGEGEGPDSPSVGQTSSFVTRLLGKQGGNCVVKKPSSSDFTPFLQQ